MGFAPRRQPDPKWKPAKKPSPMKPLARHPLSDDDLRKLTARMREHFKWDNDPRTFQILGTQAQLEGVDMTIQAPTGSGKTAVVAGPHVWDNMKGRITIMVSPLLSLEEEMVHTFKDDFGLNAIAINSENGGVSDAIVKRILSGEFQVLLTSPEMLQSDRFVDKLLRNPLFVNMVISMVLDEAHCLSHWGADFRQKYDSLGLVRAFLPRGTPVISLTATLTAHVRRDLHTKLHYTKGTSRFVNVGNDRPNVSLVVRACQHAQNSFRDLDFVVPQNLTKPEDIPKTYIYVENIQMGADIIDHISKLVEVRSSPSNVGLDAGLVRPFNATMSYEYRRAAMEAFRKGSVRIMVCTDAAGMGCNIPDIDVVVQWKLPGKLSNFVQRAGRAARGRGRTGIAILLVEPAAFSVVLQPIVTIGSASVSTASSTKVAPRNKDKRNRGRKSRGPSVKMGKKYAQHHGVFRGGSNPKKDVLPGGDQPPLDVEASDEGLTVFVQSTECRRKVWAKVYEAEDVRPATTVPCCDICSPSLFDNSRPPPKVTKKKAPKLKTGLPDLKIQADLRAWRKDIFRRNHRDAMYDPSAILDNDTITKLSSVGPLSLPVIEQLLASSWLWWERHGEEFGRFLLGLSIQFTEIPVEPKAPPKASKATPKASTKKRPVSDVSGGLGSTSQVRFVETNTAAGQVQALSQPEASGSSGKIYPPNSDRPAKRPRLTPQSTSGTTSHTLPNTYLDVGGPAMPAVLIVNSTPNTPITPSTHTPIARIAPTPLRNTGSLQFIPWQPKP